MVRKDKVKLGSYLGSPESFSSQFFQPIVDEHEFHQEFARMLDEGVLIHYKSADMTTLTGSVDGFVTVMYTDVGAIISGESASDPWLPITSILHRQSAALGTSYVRYDTIYLDKAVTASWTLFENYIRTSGVTDVVMKVGKIPGQGLIYSTPLIGIKNTGLNMTAGTHMYALLIANQMKYLEEAMRPFVIDWIYRQRSRGQTLSQLGEMGKKMFNRSQNMWPELKGLWTRFVDNVGIYLPNYLDVDVNASMDFGSEYVVGYFVRTPGGSAGENYKFMTDYMFTFIGILVGSGSSPGYSTSQYSGTSQTTKSPPITTGSQGTGAVPFDNRVTTPGGSTTTYAGGGSSTSYGSAAGYVQQMYNLIYGLINTGFKMTMESIRVLMPRVRAFGRQYTPDLQGNIATIPSYGTALDKLNQMCSGQVKDVGMGKVGAYYYKKIMLLPKEDWDKYVEDMNVITASSASGTGGAQEGFPY